ncbi:MAG: hypothetical protein KF819_13805 [Labilithrix sp.]|nr:hypothetical protein [Labilithrix sp.]
MLVAATLMRSLACFAVVSALLTGGTCIVGCSPGEGPAGECTGSSADALRTCAKGSTLTGIDVSYYQGNVNWAQVKGAGRTFAFVRVSDGLNFPDTKFAQNWPAVKSAGLVRGVYQFFRPSQDPTQQAQLLLDRIDAAGGIGPGDLPPVLDLESDGGLAASVVVARATTWLAKVEAAVGRKPIIYTAAFMSNVIGSSFTNHVLWVANYGATCPLMPGAWTDWHFWQTSDSGSVAGVSGNVDTNLFNGVLADLMKQTLQPPPAPNDAPAGPRDDVVGLAAFDGVMPGDAKPNDGSQGATIGDGDPAHDPDAMSAPISPCR